MEECSKLEVFKKAIESVPPEDVVFSILTAAEASETNLAFLEQILSPLLFLKTYRSSKPRKIALRSTTTGMQPYPLSPPLVPVRQRTRSADITNPERSKDEMSICRKSISLKQYRKLDTSKNKIQPVQFVKGKKTAQLAEILKEPQLAAGFRQFLASKFCEECFDFWKAANLFKSQFQTFTNIEQIRVAKKIYQMFIKPQSEHEVNISSRTRAQLETIFESSEDSLLLSLSESTFEEARQEITSLLANEWFPLFKQDESFVGCYKKYIEITNLSFNNSKSPRPIERLRAHDWEILLTNSQEETFMEGDIIIQQWKNNPYLYVLKKGVIRFERENKAGQCASGSLINHSGVLFGFHSVFRSTFRSFLRIVAVSDVTLRKLNTPFILSYLQSDVRFAMRFYFEIARSIGETMKESYAGVEKMTSMGLPLQPKENSSNSALSSVKEYFPDLPTSAVLFEGQVVTKGVPRESGVVFITQNYILSRYSIMGQFVKRQIDISQVSKYKTRASSVTIYKTKKKDIAYKFKNPKDATAFGIILGSLIDSRIEENSDNDSDERKGYIGKLIQAIPCKDTRNMFEVISSYSKQTVVTTYAKGDVILKQGNFYSVIAVVVQGSCRIERKINEEKIVSFVVESVREDIHGENGLTQNSHTPISLIANENGVQVLLIKYELLNAILPEKYPNNAICFYHQICKDLCERYAQLLDHLDDSR